MNNYHIYEAIGHGKDSTVYKGRKKKTIEYFAIKSVEKSQKSKVLQEVRILHALDNPNVLKFYAWYETSAHLWLVLEYCVGGDLMSLLKQDKKLPEESVHDLGFDIVRALQFLHSKGIIYCDLKPSNILLDENGRTKLCDFGLARKLSDVLKTPSSSLPQAKRGTPFYMAPELFQEGGVHSYASDLWALGCVLYECYVGNPPFIGREFTSLVKSILSDPTPSLPGSPSRSFVNLVNSLLVKDPAERIQWTELCEHAFWRTKFTPLSLPPQPAFTNMIELLFKPCLSERNREHPPRNRTPPKYGEKDSRGLKSEESSASVRGYSTPIKGTSSGRKTQTKGSSKVVEEKQKDQSNNTKGVNLLRLSRIAKSNLERENDKENYRRPLPNGCDNDCEVKIENTDMELDFNENEEDETHDDHEGSDTPTCLKEQTDLPRGTKEKMENNSNQLDASPTVNTPFSGDVRTPNPDLSSEYDEVATTPVSASPQVQNPRVQKGSGVTLDFDSSKSANDFSDVLWHASDLSVRPVMPSRKADKVSIPPLPIKAKSAADLVKMPKQQLDTFINELISILNGNAVADKQNVIRYLEVLGNVADAANILTNGPLMLVVIKMLRQPRDSSLRVQLVSLIGSLIRHSTFIDEDLANSGILGSLTDALRDKQDKVRRFSMAALGELLFYISTQGEHNKDNQPPESPSKDGRISSGWQVSNPLISLVSSLLRKGEDDMTQLYALRTIENVCSQGGCWATRFTSQDVIANLIYIFRASGKQESIRLTAGSCLVRLVRFNPPSIQQAVERLPFRDIVSALVKGSPREQQICLNLLSMALLGSHMFTNIGRHLLPLVEEKNLVPCVVSLIEHGSEVLRGKTLIFVALLCKSGKRWLPHFFCNIRLLSAVDRLVKEKDIYVQKCLDAFAHGVVSTIPGLLEVITGDIQQMMGGRRPGQTAVTSRSTPKANIHLFPVVYHLLGSASFKRRAVTSQVLQHLAILIKLTESPFQGRDDFQITLLRVLECISEEASVILGNPSLFTSDILPSLAVVYKGNKDGDARFLCLKIMFDVMVIFLNEPLEDEERLTALKSIANTHFLPMYPTLIEDEDPIPMYAQKLLVMLIEFNFIKIPDILHLKIISQCFEFLLGDLSTANVNNVMLCLALASAPELENKILSQLRVVRRIGNLLELAYAKEMEDFIEPTLGLCRAFLLRSAKNRNGFIYTKEPTLLADGSTEVGYAIDQQQCIRDIMDLGCNVSVLLELSKSHEANIADIASECIILLLREAPREATTGLLTNLPKVSAILESWRQNIPHLVMQRILHALGFSCKQYLSQAMILSISASEISRIEGTVSELKSSSIPVIADSASRVAKELQRLPRCI